MLSARGIRATFKLVGEKARVLEKRGRLDVIAALQHHDIGYHANFHSVHPTPTEYLADAGLLDGMDEFVRREGRGAEDVRRILGIGTLSCYGQPGSSWAPQAIAALARIGVAPHGLPCYLDDGSHVGLKGIPVWYANALVAYDMMPNRTRMDLHDPAQVEPGKMDFTSIADRLRGEGGGLISIFYHPCEWVHQRFWDGENFSRGANPPREQWRPPPQLPKEETEASFQRFAGYIDHIKATPNVRFVTASDLPLIYPDATHAHGATETDLDELSARIVANEAKGVDFQVLGRHAYSVADQLELLARAVGERIENRAPRFPLRVKGLLGPDAPYNGTNRPAHLDWFAFRDATRDVLDFILMEKRVPARVFVGPDPVAPADYLVTLARVYRFQRQNGKLPTEAGVELGTGVELLPARHVAKDTPNLFGGWVIHREGFRAPKVMEVARLQAWTLKPALRQ
ncbi:MAG TPA: hypothetical protein VHH73_20080 [Verrucomicrobiae bacterium]|nr:hypothetical protein [Verrucomicrobiae bacterium]